MIRFSEMEITAINIYLRTERLYILFSTYVSKVLQLRSANLLIEPKGDNLIRFGGSVVKRLSTVSRYTIRLFGMRNFALRF